MPHAHDHQGHTHHDHEHHHHHHAPATFDRAFALGVGLNVAFVLAEFLFGLRAHSLALVSDAGHNLSDVLGLSLAWAGSVLARRGPTPRRTYGMRRFSILAALGNAGFLLVAVGAITVEAIGRLYHPEPVASGIVMVIAAIGILVNTGTALAFMRGRHHDLNVRGAWLHMLGDAAASAGVVLTGLLIGLTGWLWLDPMVSLLLVALILWSTWGLARDSFDLALDAVPPGIDPDEVSAVLRALDGVVEVHDLHIWGMSTTDVALTAHLVRPCGGGEDAVLADATRQLSARFGIAHATIQLERGLAIHPCELAAPDRV
ncbi:MAG TPA: cation diffusion facilitator family transporter [Gemmatimonadaceae bacterium]|nr:cation diffusion facilitator family transporter [Gemmatimonadaceae bacterium]